MKRLVIALAYLSVAANPAHADDGRSAERDVVTDYEFADFDKIKISGAHKIDIRQSDSFSVRIEATQAAAARSLVRLDGDTLELLETGDVRRRGENDTVSVTITLPVLSQIDASGGVHGSVSDLEVDNLSIDVSGGVHLVLQGQCGLLDIDASGGSHVEANALTCTSVTADASGAAYLDVHATQSIDADASGMGKIWVQGKPAEVRKGSREAGNIFIR